MAPHYFSKKERSTWVESILLADYGPTSLWVHIDHHGGADLERRDEGTLKPMERMHLDAQELGTLLHKLEHPKRLELEPVPFHDEDGAHGYARCPACGEKAELDRGPSDKVAVILCPVCGERYATIVPGTPYYGEI